MKNKKLVASLLVSSVMLVTSITAFAETADTTTQTTVAVSLTPTTTTATATQTTTPTAEDQKLASAIAKTYNITVTAQNVANLHVTNIGYGEISKAYGFAALSGKSVSDVLGMKQTMGWGEIAKTLGVKVSAVTRSDEAVQHAVNTTKEDGKAANHKGQNATNSSNTNSGNAGGNGGGNGGGHGGGHR